MQRLPPSVLLAAALLAPVPIYGQQSEVRQTSTLAFFYSKGLYDQDSPTYVRYLPYSHEVSLPGWRFKASVPVLEVEGPGNVLIDAGNLGQYNNDSGSDGRVSERGVGDLTLSVSYELPLIAEGLPFLDISLELKLPTADERRGLGTGRPDVALQFDAFQSVADTTLFATLAYRYRHRSPVYAGLRDSVTLSLGGSRPVSERWHAGLIYDFRQAASLFTGDTHELLPFVSWAASPRWGLMLYMVEGFSRDSADTAVGAQLSYRW